MKNFLILSLLLAFLTTEVCAQWKPAGDKIKTQWANKINTSAVLPEYPRPIMERNEWKNLNGLWEYAITDLGGNVPAHFDGQIWYLLQWNLLYQVWDKESVQKRNYGIPVHLKCLLLGKIKMYYFISVLWTGKQIFG